MKLSITLSALLAAGFMAASAERAGAVVYCQYVSYPAGCVARAGVVLRQDQWRALLCRPALALSERPCNRGGPVNRVGRR